MENLFGKYLREKRENLRQKDKRYSLRQVAYRIGIEPSYLSKIERGDPAPLSEGKIYSLSERIKRRP